METETPGEVAGQDRLTLRPRVIGFGNVVDDAVEIVSRRFWLFVKLTCVAYLPWTLLLLAFNLTVAQAMEQANLADLNALMIVLVTVMLPLLIVYYLVIAPFTAGAFTYAAAELYEGREPGFRDSLRFVFRRFHRVFLVNIIYVVLMSAFPLLTIGVSVAMVGTGVNEALTVIVVFGGIAICLIACLLVGWLLFFSLQAVVVEGLGVFRGLERSFKLSYPHLLPILAAFIVFFSVRMLLGGVASIIPQLHVQVVANSIASGMIAAFETVVAVVLYFSCRSRLENYDLLLLAREVEAGRPQAPEPNIFSGLSAAEGTGT